MKTSLGVDIAAVDLQKQPNGGYTGTATAANGDVYDVTVEPPKGGKSEWKATPTIPIIERMVRQSMDSQLPSKVKTMSLTKQGTDQYSGTAVLENGVRMKVTARMDGKNLSSNWQPE